MNGEIYSTHQKPINLELTCFSYKKKCRKSNELSLTCFGNIKSIAHCGFESCYQWALFREHINSFEAHTLLRSFNPLGAWYINFGRCDHRQSHSAIRARRSKEEEEDQESLRKLKKSRKAEKSWNKIIFWNLSWYYSPILASRVFISKGM